jgi:hypothetical protein
VDLKAQDGSSSSSGCGITEVVARDLVTGEVTSYPADAVVFAIGITGKRNQGAFGRPGLDGEERATQGACGCWAGGPQRCRSATRRVGGGPEPLPPPPTPPPPAPRGPDRAPHH